MLDGVRYRDGRGIRRGGVGYLVARQDEVGIDLAGDGEQCENEDDDDRFHGRVDRAQLRLNRSDIASKNGMVNNGLPRVLQQNISPL